MKNYLAPWQLTGEGFIFIYKFSEKFLAEYGFLADYQSENFDGGLGTFMCVNYTSSNVGPYFELLFIPGKIDLKCKNLAKIKAGFTISKIYVSSQTSVENGISNWGIPKELADFQWNIINDKEIEIKVSKNGHIFFKANFRKKRLEIPVNSSIIPLNIIQKLNKKYYLTKPKAKGKMAFSNLKHLEIDGDFFPKIDKIKPLVGVNIINFNMTFPEAVVENSNN